MDKLIIFSVLVLGLQGQKPDTYKASQCFKSRGIPRVQFSCPPGDMIKISKAFHGIAEADRQTPGKDCVPSPGQEFSNCTFCDGDCIDDSMNMVYDWSTCMGNMSCARTVMQSFMPQCKRPTQFSDYLQVEYQCIPRRSVTNICSNLEWQWAPDGGYLMSPNYPDHYPTNMDCMCSLKTDPGSQIVLSFYDLLLQTKNGRCRADWLMLRQNDTKHRHCGAIMTGTKNITSRSNKLNLQFHSDDNNNVTQSFQYFTRVLKGFWLYFSATPSSSVHINCRVLKQDDQPVKEIWLDDSDYDELINTKDTDSARKPANEVDADMPGKGEDSDNMTDGMNDMKKKDKNKMENEILDKKSPANKNEINYQDGKEPLRSSAISLSRSAFILLWALLFSSLY